MDEVAAWLTCIVCNAFAVLSSILSSFNVHAVSALISSSVCGGSCSVFLAFSSSLCVRLLDADINEKIKLINVR